MASSLALAIGLAACGGGGGGGGLVSIPPPPTPTPTPTPAAATIGAPARAIAPNASLFPQATSGGPTMQAHSMTVFPLLETAVSVRPGRAEADTTTMNGGATLAFSSFVNTGDASYRLNAANPVLGLSDVLLTHDPGSGAYKANLAAGAAASLDIFTLSWTTYGSWAVVMPDGTRTEAAFVTGYATPTGSVPTTGTATYNGITVGRTYHPQAGEVNGARSYNVNGDATLVANFGSGVITGSLTNMTSNASWYDSVPWNSVSLLGAISGGQFTGTSAATSAPANPGALGGSATGTFAGMFFGPSAQELGAVWTLYDGNASATGTIGARSGTGSPWDY
jgi:hypothetical protein